MNEEEIDSWYDEEKQKIFNKYSEDIEKNKNKEEAEKEYKEKMKKAREKYINLYEKSKKLNLIKKYSKNIKGFINKLIRYKKE